MNVNHCVSLLCALYEWWKPQNWKSHSVFTNRHGVTSQKAWILKAVIYVMCAFRLNLSVLDVVNLITVDDEYNSWRSLLTSWSPYLKKFIPLKLNPPPPPHTHTRTRVTERFSSLAICKHTFKMPYTPTECAQKRKISLNKPASVVDRVVYVFFFDIGQICILYYIPSIQGTAVAQWLRCYATNR